MRRLLSLLLAVGFLASFIGHGLAHSGNIKEEACVICAAAPRALQAELEVAASFVLSCDAVAHPAARSRAGAVLASSARAPPR